MKQIPDDVYFYIQRPSSHPSDLRNRIERLKIELAVLNSSKQLKPLKFLRLLVFWRDELKNFAKRIVLAGRFYGAR